MIRRIQKILRYTLFSAVGFGFAGMILGVMHTTEDDWMWLVGFAIIGGFIGAGFGFVIGQYKKIIKLLLSGAVAGALTWWLISTSDFEDWLQMAILGLVAGAFLGAALGIFSGESKKTEVKYKEIERPWECDECGAAIGEEDNYCPSCGEEFE